MTVKPKKDATIECLTNLIDKHYDLSDIVYSSEVEDDLSSSVRFDMENLERFGTEYSYNHLPGLENLEGYEMLGGCDSEYEFPVLWVAAGGDWELPLVFIIYIGEDDKLHAYVPYDGNAYNHDKGAAYGNNDGDPVWGNNDPRYVFNVGKMRADIVKKLLNH